MDVPLPSDVTLVSQILWGSIGWSVGELLVLSNEHSVYGLV